jgi:hypothetical protein
VTFITVLCDGGRTVLKPERHLLSFGSSYPYHGMASAGGDAGFELRNQMSGRAGEPA